MNLVLVSYSTSPTFFRKQRDNWSDVGKVFKRSIYQPLPEWIIDGWRDCGKKGTAGLRYYNICIYIRNLFRICEMYNSNTFICVSSLAAQLSSVPVHWRGSAETPTRSVKDVWTKRCSTGDRQTDRHKASADEEEDCEIEWMSECWVITFPLRANFKFTFKIAFNFSILSLVPKNGGLFCALLFPPNKRTFRCEIITVVPRSRFVLLE